METLYHKCSIYKRLIVEPEQLTQKTEVKFLEEERSLGNKRVQGVLVTGHLVLRFGDTVE
jgi:hypothetical protein